MANTYITVTCTWCGRAVEKDVRYIKYQNKRGCDRFFCNRSHATHYGNSLNRLRAVESYRGRPLCSEVELAWLAGLLEGEGSFVSGPPSDRSRPRIALNMTDEDVVKRVSKLFGREYHTIRSRKSPKWSDNYRVSLNGARAMAFMRALLPHMGRRRAAKIRELIEEYDTYYERLRLH